MMEYQLSVPFLFHALWIHLAITSSVQEKSHRHDFAVDAADAGAGVEGGLVLRANDDVQAMN